MAVKVYRPTHVMDQSLVGSLAMAMPLGVQAYAERAQPLYFQPRPLACDQIAIWPEAPAQRDQKGSRSVAGVGLLERRGQVARHESARAEAEAGREK